ncbi:hypothetical protein ACK1KB_06115 [Chryseobacterium sp. TY3]
MKNLTKLTFALFAFTLLFTACSSSDDDSPQPEQVAKEITAEELSDYIIIEEYKPKASASAASGDKPILVTTYIAYTNQYMLRIAEAWSRYEYTLQTTYDASTGITSVETYFGYYDLTRDPSGQIVVIKSRHSNDSQYSITKSFDSQYLQLVKKTQSIYDNTSYKKITGNGYYRFRISDAKWRYKENAVPTDAELTWSYSQANNHIWYGKDGGTAQYKNLFIALPKGNGWKGNHKDKDLLLINTVEKDHYKAVGDIGIYEVNN